MLCVREHPARVGLSRTAASVAFASQLTAPARRVAEFALRPNPRVCPHCMHAQLKVPRATCAGNTLLWCTRTAWSRHLSLSRVHTIGCAGGCSVMGGESSSFFEASPSASDLGGDRRLQIETNPADLRSSSSPEMASQGAFRSAASSRAMRLGGAGSHVERLSSFFESFVASRDLGGDCHLQIETNPADLRSSSSREMASQALRQRLRCAAAWDL